MSEYYEKVGSYFDQDAPEFENRYWENKTLQKIRASFRKETLKHSFQNALEVGFGPGLDLIYFGEKFPEKNFYGIDISTGMCEFARKEINSRGLTNIQIATGSVEDLQTLFPVTRFDIIYVYFGALNTVEDLSLAASCLKQKLAPEGKIILTVINKWYLAGMFLPLMKLKFKIAFKRLKKTWGGYSPKRQLESKCYSPRQINNAFQDFKITRKRGYSIFFPAWYQDHLRKKLGKLYDFTWKIDKILNHTPLWCMGEYTLFVIENSGEVRNSTG